MITGGSTANLAIILVDARQGVVTQTCRHSYLVSLLGIRHLVLAVNKMDLVDFSKERFDKIVSDYKAWLDAQGINIPDLQCIPLSALEGDNVVEKSANTPWYEGQSLMDYLETVPIDQDINMQSLRYPVQYVLRPNLDFRGFAGKLASGVVKVGDEVMALPSGKSSRVKEIVTYDGNLDEAFAPQSVTITLEDEIDLSRGEMLVHPTDMPHVGHHLRAMMVWMDEQPLDATKAFYIKHTTNTTRAYITKVHSRVDINTAQRVPSDGMALNEIAEVSVTAAAPLIFDSYAENRQTGAFIVIDPVTNFTSAVGMIIGEDEARRGAATTTVNLSEYNLHSEEYDTVIRFCEELRARTGIDIECIK